MKSPINSLFRSQKGSVLILVLGVLVMLSLFAISVGYMVRQRMQVISKLEAREKLRYIAEAGVKKALSVLSLKGEEHKVDTLTQSWSDSEPNFKKVPVGDGYFTVLGLKDSNGQRYGLVDEESKINLNLLSKPDTFKRLLELTAELPPETALEIAYSVMDWRDTDEDAHDVGAESRYYKDLHPPYVAKNDEISSLEELLYVKGMTPEILESIRPYITLDGSGQINANTASDKVLLALGLTEQIVSKIMAYRVGRDRIEGTSDDGVFSSTEAVSMNVSDFEYLDPGEVELLNSVSRSGQMTVGATFFSVKSIGSLNRRDENMVVNAVVNKTGEIKRWQEEYLKVSS